MDDELIKEDIMPAEALDLAAFPTSDFMTEAQQQALSQAARLDAENRLLKEQAAQRETKLRADWSSDVAVLRETIKSFAADARAKNDVIALQERTINELRVASATSQELKASGEAFEDLVKGEDVPS